MYSLHLSHHKKTLLVKNNNVIITTINQNDIPFDLIFNGCNSGTPSSIDNFLSNKLSNMWSSRQNIKGEGGESILTMNLVIRMVNLFTNTGFKGMLLEIEAVDDNLEEEKFNECLEKINSILIDINIKDAKIGMNSGTESNPLCVLGNQYVEALEG